MSKFSNSTKINNMINEIVNNYGALFMDVVKDSLRNDIQKLVDEAKKEVKEFYQNYVTDKDCDTKMIDEAK